MSNERIALSDSPNRDLVDAQHSRNLVFFLKQYKFGMAFPFTSFFIEVFQYYRVTPRMLTPDSILFIGFFESICLCWSFAPSSDLFLIFLRLVLSAN